MIKPKAIFIGASAGGITVVQELLRGLNSIPKPPIVVAQHLPKTAAIHLELVFGAHFKGHIQEATDKMEALPGGAYFAPPGYHLLIERDMTFSLSQDELVHHARPSIDVLFESAAWALGAEACAILLTGANADGASGLKKIKEVGGTTIVQEPQSAEFPFMPQSALQLAEPSHIFTILQMAKFIDELALGGSR